MSHDLVSTWTPGRGQIIPAHDGKLNPSIHTEEEEEDSRDQRRG